MTFFEKSWVGGYSPNSAELDRCGIRLGNIKIYRADLTNDSLTFVFEKRFSQIERSAARRSCELFPSCAQHLPTAPPCPAVSVPARMQNFVFFSNLKNGRTKLKIGEQKQFWSLYKRYTSDFLISYF